MYNPFVPFTDSIFRDNLKEGIYLYVIQRFEWPVVEKGKGFMVSTYRVLDDAQAHVMHLRHQEGKLIDAREHLDKIQKLVANGSGYRLFLNKFKESDWKRRIMKIYRDKIIGYLRSCTQFSARDTIDITFRLEYGRVLAAITNGERAITINAIDLIT